MLITYDILNMISSRRVKRLSFVIKTYQNKIGIRTMNEWSTDELIDKLLSINSLPSRLSIGIGLIGILIYLKWSSILIILLAA